MVFTRNIKIAKKKPRNSFIWNVNNLFLGSKLNILSQCARLGKPHLPLRQLKTKSKDYN
jgi:hypothetical protein